MAKKNKTKEIKLKTRFNPATAKYEPVLPSKKGKLKFKFKFNWKTILILILLFLFLYALFSGWLNFSSVPEPSTSPADLFKK